MVRQSFLDFVIAWLLCMIAFAVVLFGGMYLMDSWALSPGSARQLGPSDSTCFFGCCIYSAPFVSALVALGYVDFRKQRKVARAKRGLCVHCGYNLAGNVTGRCPECGAEARRRENDDTRSDPRDSRQ
jgi:uncharacterized paraquat-inducible protein A